MRRRLNAILLSGALSSGALAQGQGTLSTLFTNGPTGRRVNITVLSEGYQTNQLGQFLLDAAGTVSNLLASPPYAEYTSYFNAFAISVASVDSGSDHPLTAEFKNTYFNSAYNGSGPTALITIPPNAWDTNYSHGKGKIQTLLSNLVPACNFSILVVNYPQSGGSGQAPTPGDPMPLAISSLPSSTYGPEIVVHESGHMIGNLADEYSTAYPGFIPTERPNATTNTLRTNIPWNTWILPDTPVPTANDFSNSDLVGLFQGAEYQTNGWYRPKFDCKMNHLYVPFCEVCSEQLVKSIYRLVRPIDSFSPASTNLSLLSTQAVSFGVTPMQPATHNLTVQWVTNNAPVPGATNTTFQLSAGILGNGSHTLRVIVADPTPLVRNDPAGLLRATNTWFLNVSLNQLTLIDPLLLASGSFRLTVTGTAPQGFVMQASSNLLNWVSLSTNNLSAGSFAFTNSGPLNSPRRLYRAYSPP